MFCLGIDGGGSGCRARLADPSGRVLGEGRSGPANIRSDLPQSLRSVLEATAGATAAAGVSPEEITAVLGLAGANVSACAKELAGLLPFGRAQIVSDGVTTARGALGGADGLVAALGTGSVFIRQIGGVQSLAGGRGFVLGDEASGAQLGRALLAEALRAADGISPMTPLLQEVLAEFSGDEALTDWSLSAAPQDFAAFAPRLAASQDPAARQIMQNACDALESILNALQPAHVRLPVVFLGGLAEVFARQLSGRVDQRAPLGSALDGAVQMALELAQGAA